MAMVPHVIPAGRLSVYGLDIPPEAHSFEGFRSWFDSLGENVPRASFVRGSFYIEMPPSYETHAPLAEAIIVVLHRLAKRLALGRYHLPPSWVTEERSRLSAEPDGFLVSEESLDAGRVHINPDRPTELMGAPDMVLEVVSASSTRKDLVDLPPTYAAAGVREYWIADGRPEQPTLRILVIGPDRRYAEQSPDRAGWVVSPLWGRAFRIEGRADRRGQTEFELRVLTPRSRGGAGRTSPRRKAS